MSGILYLCPTPIGNLGDITLRTLETLKTADIIAAEDTRRTLPLLTHFGIKNKLISYHEHNKIKMGGEILCELLNGKTVALVSDAGMPGISDPGLELVKLAIENEITVTALPGASAFVCALAASGLPTGRFCFEGFLPVNKRARKTRLESVKNETRTLIFYEAPHKLLNTLRDMRDFFGERKIVLAREISKKFEEFFRATLSEAINFYEKSPPRGEFVLVIEGAPEKSESDALKHEAALKLAAAGAEKLMNDGAKLREVAAIIAEKFSLKKNEAKAICMTFKNDNLKQN